MNLASLVDEHPADALALHDGSRWLSWGELRRRVRAVTTAMVDEGVVPGDRVALVWPTSVDLVVSYLAVLSSGAVAVPLNPSSPSVELDVQLDAVKPSLVLGGSRSALDVAGICEEAGGSDKEGRLASAGARGAAGALMSVPRAPEDPAVLLYTSGTAGDPRPAVLSHGNLMANIRQMLALPGGLVAAGDVGLAVMPMFHIFGLNVTLGLALATGAALVPRERFDPQSSLADIGELGVTLLTGAPGMFGAWLDLPGLTGKELGGVRRALSGAAALDPAIARGFEERFGLPLWQGYGLTEASPGVASTLATGRNVPGSVGGPLPGVEVRLVDDLGEDALAGDPGELWVRGPNVFSGYWHDSEATAEVLAAGGWLRTGDIGVIGPDGDLFVTDRKKDLVIVSGFNVFPAEVERVLAAAPGVAEAVVLGRPDATQGETVEAVIVPEPGAALSEPTLHAYCAANLARYKCPSIIRFVDELPRGLTGKALRRALRSE
ncbi:MAG: AMP-binding protein [Acidimicrobiales bacterium]